MKGYIEAVKTTENTDYESIKDRMIFDNKIVRLEHAAHGMITESAEFLDQLKKHVFYGKNLDEVNLKEELGDLMWYIAVAADSLDTNMEELMARNMEKLRARYGDKFSKEAALNRNLATEREVLEK